MRPLLSALALAALAATPAFAQTRPAQPPGGATTTRYFQLSGEIMGDPSADAYLIETRQGSRIVSAELDVCHTVAVGSSRRDRFVVELAPDSGRLAGTTTSQEDKAPVSVRLLRQGSGDTVDYEGSIKRGDAETQLSSADNRAVTEEEFRTAQIVEGNLTAEPSDFTEVSPEALFVRVKREAAIALAKDLRNENVKLTLESLVQDCAALRSGEQFVRVDVDPQRAPALVAKLRQRPGVVAVGWTSGTYALDNAVALDPAAWQGADGREKLMAAVAPAIAKFVKGTAQASAFDSASGVTTLKFKRPNVAVPGLDLTDAVEVAAAVSLDKPVAGKILILWIGAATITTSDESAGPRLGIVTSAGGEGEPSGDSIDTAALVAAIARDLSGRTWDSERARWK